MRALGEEDLVQFFRSTAWGGEGPLRAVRGGGEWLALAGDAAHPAPPHLWEVGRVDEDEKRMKRG